MADNFALANAFVRIRPSTDGFRAEADAGIRGALMNLNPNVRIGADTKVAKLAVADLRGYIAALATKLPDFRLVADDKGIQSTLAGVYGELLKLDKKARSNRLTMLGVTETQAKLLGLDKTLDGIAARLKTMGGLEIGTGDAERRLATIKIALIALTSQAKEVKLGVSDPGALAKIASVEAALRTLKDTVATIDLKTDIAPLVAAEEILKDLTSDMRKLTDTTDGGSKSIRLWGLGWGAWGRVSLTAIHWITTGIVELLAVLIPATAAAAAWMAVWMQAAFENVPKHMMAVFTATEALGSITNKTAGQMVGLGDALQTAQDKANPDVYQALGAAIKLVNTQSGAFTQAGLAVGKVFDTFTAKLVYDFSSAGDAGQTMNSIFKHMVPDLTQLGSFFGDLGHAVANAAAQMPGLVEVLLKIFSTAAHFVNVLVSMAAGFSIFHISLITATIAAEEFFRWGGLLVTLMNKMGITAVAMGPKFLSFQRFGAVIKGLGTAVPNAVAKIIGGLGGLVGKLGNVIPGAAKAGSAMEGLGAKILGVTREIPVWQVLIGIVAVAALGFLIDKMVTARTAAQQFGDSLQAALGKASNLQSLTVISAGLQQLREKIMESAASVRDLSSAQAIMRGRMDDVAAVGGRFSQSINVQGLALQNAKDEVTQYTAAQQQLIGESTNVLSNSARLAAMYHTTIPGAMALADVAGVKLTGNIFGQGEAAFIARTKIADLVQGYRSMGAPMSVVGNDMVAIAIQSGVQASKVATLTGAWSAFMTSLTGGTNGLAGFQNSLKNMLATAASFSHNLGKGSGISATIGQFATDLTNSGKKGSQAWQNFDQVVGQTAPDLINWLTTAGTMGVISGAKFTRAAKDMIAQLLPFAAQSKTARAELSGLVQMAGGPATTNFQQLTKWVGNVKDPTKDLEKIIGDTTVKMSQMSKVAQNLGTVLNTELVDMMDKARLSASGVQGKMVAYTKDIEDNTVKTEAGDKDRKALIDALVKTGLTSKAAQAYIDALTTSIRGQTKASGPNIQTLQTMIDKLKDSHTPASKLASIIATELNPAIKDGALKNDKMRDAIFNMAQQAGYAGPNKIKPLTGWMDKNRDSTKDATQWVKNFNTSLSELNGKKVSATVVAHAIGQGLVRFTEKGLPSNAQGFLSFHAKGALIPGSGNGDTVPAMLTPGETVVPKHLTPLVAPLMKQHNVPGFARGGLVPGFASGGLISTDFGRNLSHLASESLNLQGWTGAKTANFQQAAENQFMKAAISAGRAAFMAQFGGGAAIASWAEKWLGRIPYVWGGRSIPGGADCSGFVQTTYKHFGINSPGTSETQGAWVKRGPPVPGGLAFYHSPAGGTDPGHVAIVKNAGTVISQGGGMGPKLEGLHFLPLLWTGSPPGGFGTAGGGTVRENQLASLWREAGGPANLGHLMSAIAMAESGGNPSAHNPSGASGLWQILGQIVPGNIFNPLVNAENAVAKWRSQGLGAWVTYTNGAYLQFMNKGGKVKTQSFDTGGILQPGVTMAVNNTGKPEHVMSHGGHTELNRRIGRVLRFIHNHPNDPAYYTNIENQIEALHGRDPAQRKKLLHQIRPFSETRQWVKHIEHMMGVRDAHFGREIAHAMKHHRPKLADHFRARIREDKDHEKTMNAWLNRVTKIETRAQKKRDKSWIDSLIVGDLRKLGLPVISFDQGGWLKPGATLAVNNTGRAERILSPGPFAKNDLTVRLEFGRGPTGSVEAALWNWLLHSIHVKGGGDVQMALGRKA